MAKRRVPDRVKERWTPTWEPFRPRKGDSKKTARKRQYLHNEHRRINQAFPPRWHEQED